MTSEQLALLSPEEKRVKIADFLGLQLLRDGKVAVGEFLLARRKDKVGDWKMQGDWLSDLNAMHDAVDRLTEDQQITWAKHLMEMMPKHLLAYPEWFHIAHATAAKRADAFLLTVLP